MDQVETVRGSVPLANLGGDAHALHEHIFIKHPELEQNYPNPEWDEGRRLSPAPPTASRLCGTGRESGRSST